MQEIRFNVCYAHIDGSTALTRQNCGLQMAQCELDEVAQLTRLSPTVA